MRKGSVGVFIFLFGVSICVLPVRAEEKPYDPSISVYPVVKSYKHPKAWGLSALLARKTKISDAQKNGNGVYQSERTVFPDPDLGGEVWKLTHDNVHDHHWYQDMSPWNCNGSKIMFRADRIQAPPPDQTRALLMDADGTNARRHTTELRQDTASRAWTLDSRRPAWSKVNPDLHYSLRFGVLYELRVAPSPSPAATRTGFCEATCVSVRSAALRSLARGRNRPRSGSARPGHSGDDAHCTRGRRGRSLPGLPAAASARGSFGSIRLSSTG